LSPWRGQCYDLHRADFDRPGASLAQLAQATGYFDQSHFSRGFQAVTGQPPGRFFRASTAREGRP
jgi:AraC-like DNA-binding protein